MSEARWVAGVLIIGMVARSKITKYPLYRFRVGVRTDFQDFVMIGEHGRFHNMPAGSVEQRNRSPSPARDPIPRMECHQK
jgi:hypothetical protein